MLGRRITLLIGFPTLVSRVPVSPPLFIQGEWFFIFGPSDPQCAANDHLVVVTRCWFRWRPYALLPMNMDGIRALLLQMSPCVPLRSLSTQLTNFGFNWCLRFGGRNINWELFFYAHQSAEGRDTDSPPSRVTRLVASSHHHSMFTSARCLSLRKNVKIVLGFFFWMAFGLRYTWLGELSPGQSGERLQCSEMTQLSRKNRVALPQGCLRPSRIKSKRSGSPGAVAAVGQQESAAVQQQEHPCNENEPTRHLSQNRTWLRKLKSQLKMSRDSYVWLSSVTDEGCASLTLLFFLCWLGCEHFYDGNFLV